MVALVANYIGFSITTFVVLHVALHAVDKSFSLESSSFAFLTFIIFWTVSQMLIFVVSFLVKLIYACLATPLIFAFFLRILFKACCMVVILTVIASDEGFIWTPTFTFHADLDLLSCLDQFLLICEVQFSLDLANEYVNVFQVLLCWHIWKILFQQSDVSIEVGS